MFNALCSFKIAEIIVSEEILLMVASLGSYNSVVSIGEPSQQKKAARLADLLGSQREKA